MAEYTIDCPACPENACVSIDDDRAIYRIEAYDSKPRRLPFRSPTPSATLGEKLYLDRDQQYRQTTSCESGHHLWIYAAAYVHVPRETCLYQPAAVPQVSCPFCQYRYGTHEEFVHRPNRDSVDSTHVLRSVTTDPAAGHVEVPAISRRVCTNHDRLAVTRNCPHCGRQSYFNYRTLELEPTVYFVGIDEQ